MKAVNRNSFIVSKALKTFVMAAVLTAAASQLAHTADSMIVGHVVGPDAVSAINLVLPFADIDRFFKDNKVSAADAFKINICCEELMTNIATFTQGKVTSRTFDIHILVHPDGIFVTLKDAGKPFDPVMAGKMSDPNIGTEGNEHMGLRLVTNIIPDITYKYMYGQNTVFIWQKAEQPSC